MTKCGGPDCEGCSEWNTEKCDSATIKKWREKRVAKAPLNLFERKEVNDGTERYTNNGRT